MKKRVALPRNVSSQAGSLVLTMVLKLVFWSNRYSEVEITPCSISGANSYSGQKGREAVVFHSDVIFIFDNSSKSSKGMTVERGQFPEFL